MQIKLIKKKEKCTISNKSQIFMFDMIASIIILILVISITFNYYINTNLDIEMHDLNKNILNGFTHTKINDLNNNEIRDLFKAGKIKNIHNTIAQQISEFYYFNKSSDAKNLTKIFIRDFITKQMNFNLTLINQSGGTTILYEKMHRQEIPINKAEIVSTSSRQIFGFNNITSFYGPYIFEIKIWK